VEFTTMQQGLIWEGWREGESFQRVADRVGQPAHVIQYYLRGHGGIKPLPHRRDHRHLTATEREELSRGIAAGWSIRTIAASLHRPHHLERDRAKRRPVRVPGGGCRSGGVGSE
jgi:hypothetical protein